MASSSTSCKRGSFKVGLSLFAACVMLFLPRLGYSKNSCPWLNEVTATGFLGGEAVGEMTDASAGHPAVCTFTQLEKGVTRTLRITVEQTADSHQALASTATRCGAHRASLPAIGNEAVMCLGDDRKGISEAMVVGRVRDQVFTITLHSTMKNDRMFAREALQSTIRLAAEQVSGNLF